MHPSQEFVIVSAGHLCPEPGEYYGATTPIVSRIFA